MKDKTHVAQNPIIDKLISLLEIKYVYESKQERNGLSRSTLIVILKGNSSSLTQELSSMVAKIFQEETDYLYRIFPFEYAEKQLRTGNLFFVYGCSLGKLIFHNTDDEVDIFQGYRLDLNAMTVIRSDFQKEFVKINAFMDGATFFIEKENYAQSAFLLHQYLELWFRTVELFMMGRERKCHSIKEHQTYIKVFVPELGNLFNTDEEEELSILRLLDEAYITSRYQKNYHINEVQIKKIRRTAERMFVLVSRLFEDKLAKCQKEMDRHEPNMESSLNQGDASRSEIPELAEEAMSNELRELAKTHFYTLKQCPNKKGLFYVNLRTEGYQELSFMISNLIKACITALQSDCFSSRAVPQPEHNIREVLGYILDMMPYEEMEFLDKIRDMLPDKEANG